MSRSYRLLIPIVVILIVAIFIDLPKSPGIHIGGISRDFNTRLGLDLVGGVQALLEAAQMVDAETTYKLLDDLGLKELTIALRNMQ